MIIAVYEEKGGKLINHIVITNYTVLENAIKMVKHTFPEYQDKYFEEVKEDE